VTFTTCIANGHLYKGSARMFQFGYWHKKDCAHTLEKVLENP